MCAAMDLMRTHTDNDIFKKQLNSMAIIIGLNSILLFKVYSNKTDQPLLYQQLLIIQ